MVSVGAIFLQLLQNVSLFALVAAAYVAIARSQKLAQRQQQIAIGIAFAMGALLAMSNNIVPAPGVAADGRSVMTGLVGVFGGPIATVITVASVVLYRLWLGGSGVSASIIGAVCAGLLGLGFVWLRGRLKFKFGMLPLLALGIAVVTQGFIWFLLLNPNASLEVALKVVAPVYVVVPLGIALLGLVLIREDLRLTLQARLHEQTQLFEAIFNSMSEGVTVADAKGNIIMANSMSAMLSGAAPTDVPSEEWSRKFGVFLPDGKTPFDPAQMPLKRAIEGQETNNIEMVVHNAGNRHPRLLSVSGRPLRDTAGETQGGVVVFHDVSEQRAIEETLRRSEERFALAIAGSQDGIWDYNPVTGQAWFSPRFKELLGYRDDEFPHDIQFWKDRMLPEDHAASTEQFFDYEADRRDCIEIIQRFRHKDGHLVYFSNRATGIRGDDGKIHRLVGAATDITNQKEREFEMAELLAQLTETQAQIKYAHDEMERHATLLRSLTDAMPALVSFVDPQQRYAYCNKEYQDVFGVEATAIVGRPIKDVVEAEIYEIVAPYIDKALKGQEVAFVRPLIAQGERRYIEQRYVPEIRADGTVMGFYAIGWDITERHQREQHLSTAASTDPLTGLLNRRGITDLINGESIRWQGGELGGALLYLDIDHFKRINDRLGHDAGDAVLKAFADRIRGVVRATDKVARLGGDEFVILLTARDGEETAKRIAGTLLERMKKPVIYGGADIAVTTSIGIALVARPDLTAQQILKEADVALYEAKAAGRATFSLRKAA